MPKSAATNAYQGHDTNGPSTAGAGRSGRASPSRPCSHGSGRPAGSWAWPTATILPIGRLELPQGQRQPVPEPLRQLVGWRSLLQRQKEPRGPGDLLLPAPTHRPDHGQVNVAEELLFSQAAAGNGFTARCLPSIDRERLKPPEDTATSFQHALDTIAAMREMVLNRRQDQDASMERLLGVQRRPVINPETDARDLLAAASAEFDS